MAQSPTDGLGTPSLSECSKESHIIKAREMTREVQRNVWHRCETQKKKKRKVKLQIRRFIKREIKDVRQRKNNRQ